jgi:hypothetical protein
VLECPLNHAEGAPTGSGNVRRRNLTWGAGWQTLPGGERWWRSRRSEQPGRAVLAFLRDFEAVKNRAPQNSVMAGLVELMGGAQEAPEVYGAMAQLRATAGESR